MTTATRTKARIATEAAKTAGQSFKKSVIIEGFADRSEGGKRR
jgi:hypothetical protein